MNVHTNVKSSAALAVACRSADQRGTVFGVMSLLEIVVGTGLEVGNGFSLPWAG